MRRLKVRGKPADLIGPDALPGYADWVYGYYVAVDKHHYVFSGKKDTTGLYPTWERCVVNPDTIGRYTGLNDKNGREIYTGDIVRARHTSPLSGKKIVDHYKVTLARSTLYKMIHSSGQPRWDKLLFMHHERVELIGNIYDNPELIK